jgi:hypothetical protein
MMMMMMSIQQRLLLFENDVFKVTSNIAQTLL